MVMPALLTKRSTSATCFRLCGMSPYDTKSCRDALWALEPIIKYNGKYNKDIVQHVSQGVATLD